MAVASRLMRNVLGGSRRLRGCAPLLTGTARRGVPRCPGGAVSVSKLADATTVLHSTFAPEKYLLLLKRRGGAGKK